MNSARENILTRLKQKNLLANGEVPLFVPGYDWSVEEKIEKFSQCIQAVHAEVHCCNKPDWVQTLEKILREKSVSRMLLSLETEIGREVQANSIQSIELLQYEQSMEQWKQDFFSDVTAGLTTTKGAIAETGSLMLWPTIQEPRLISLVPPIHIAVLDAENLYDTFAQAVQEQGWADGMPTNALLISGPSKTADIEQVLAYGVHGPKELIVIIRE